MHSTNTGTSLQAADSPPQSADHLQQRLVEAACYAVLRRIAPVLRHDVAGFLQPVRMLLLVLQRRVVVPEPDLPAITTHVATVSALAKEASTGCMDAMDWMAPREDVVVSLRSCLNAAAKLLVMELSAQRLEITHNVSDDATTIPVHFFRSVVMGALLAFCDQRTPGRILQISLEPDAGNSSTPNRLVLQMLPGDGPDDHDLVPSLAIENPLRRIEWSDVEVMAGSFGVATTRSQGWLAVALPKSA